MANLAVLVLLIVGLIILVVYARFFMIIALVLFCLYLLGVSSPDDAEDKVVPKIDKLKEKLE